MNRWNETFSFGSHFQQSKSSRYTGRRRRGLHRHTATASATTAPSAGTCRQERDLTMSERGRHPIHSSGWDVVGCSALSICRGAAEHSNMLCTEGWMQLAKRKLEYHHACKPAAEVVQAPASQALTAMRVPPTAMHGYQLDHRQQLNRNATPGDATGHAADRTTALAHTAR